MIRDNLECMRVVIRGYKRENESVDELVERIKADNTIMTALLNTNPNLNNVGVVRELISNDSFKKSL